MIEQNPFRSHPNLSYLIKDKHGGGRVFFYYQPFVVVNEEHYLRSLLKVASELGSYVGVLLGVSFLDGARTLRKAWRTRAAKNQVGVERRDETIPARF